MESLHLNKKVEGSKPHANKTLRKSVESHVLTDLLNQWIIKILIFIKTRQFVGNILMPIIKCPFSSGSFSSVNDHRKLSHLFVQNISYKI